MSRLIKADRTIAKQISDYRKISGFRNALVHGYDSIDDETGWNIIVDKLPVLQRELRELLSRGETGAYSIPAPVTALSTSSRFIAGSNR